MGKIMEAVFCVFYLVFTVIMGFKILNKSEGNRQIRLYGIMTLVLVFGDAFHLIPRILAAVNPSGDYGFSLGIGKLITSVTMTVFYLIMYFVYELRYEKSSKPLRITVIVLSLIRIALCLLPQNDWTGAAPVIWGIYRNIPFTLLGIVMVILFYRERKDRFFKWLWLGILLSFAFYLPVVLWADISPIIGMLMLPKTCMYMWIVVMGFNQAKNSDSLHKIQ